MNEQESGHFVWHRFVLMFCSFHENNFYLVTSKQKSIHLTFKFVAIENIAISQELLNDVSS